MQDLVTEMFARLALLAGCVFCSIGLTLDTVLSVFVRGRPIVSILALSILVLAICWEFAKYTFMVRGHRWLGSAIIHERRTGVMAIAIGVTMSVGSVMGVSHGVYRSLAPTEEEADVERGKFIAQAKAQKQAEAEEQKKNQKAALLKEYEALVALGRITQARETYAKYESSDAEYAKAKKNDDSTNSMDISLIPILNRGEYSEHGMPPWVSIVGCVCFGILLEAVITGIVIISSISNSRTRTRRSSSPFFPSDPSTEQKHVTASIEELVHEELRTGILRPTVAEVRNRMRCGSVKAMRVLALAKEKGYVLDVKTA